MYMKHDSYIEKRVFTKSKMTAAAILKLNVPLPFHNRLTNPHQTYCACTNEVMQCVSDVKETFVQKSRWRLSPF